MSAWRKNISNKLQLFDKNNQNLPFVVNTWIYFLRIIYFIEPWIKQDSNLGHWVSSLCVYQSSCYLINNNFFCVCLSSDLHWLSPWWISDSEKVALACTFWSASQLLIKDTKQHKLFFFFRFNWFSLLLMM